MKQKDLLKKLYLASINCDTQQTEQLLKKELKKIFKRKEKGKSFNVKWTLVQ